MTAQNAARILVVDDDPDICENLSDILTDLSYHVDCAQDGAAALRLVDQQRYDVALLDLKMPGMDGLTLFREIKKRSAGTVALLVTAYANASTTDEALAAGTWKVVAKPVDPRKLLSLLDEALEQPLVLVVDDDRDLCANLWDVLRERGFRVCLAHGSAEAADQLRATAFNVVLIDMKTPDGDGSGVFRIVREANPQACTVLITGFRSEMDQVVEQTLAEGADAVCYKPFDIPNLLETLDLLAKKRPQANRGPD